MDLSSHGGEIPIPITSKYVGGGDHVHVHGHGHGHGSFLHDHHPPPSHLPIKVPPPVVAVAVAAAPPPPPPPLAAAPPATTSPDQDDHHLHLHHQLAPYTKKSAVVKYRECLKNHAASIGGNATDGCGEFMPSGEEGTMEALKCSACNCHRNFHRKEVEGEHHHLHSSSFDFFHPHPHHLKGRKVVGQKGVLIDGYGGGYNPVAAAHNSLIPMPSPHHMIMPLGAIQTSESDEMEGIGGGCGGGIFSRAHPMAKKRFRTKFTPEQKEKMLSFAERAGWRLQKQEESVVQQFCQEIGVKRRVLKVWMHNNKHSLAKKNTIQLE